MRGAGFLAWALLSLLAGPLSWVDGLEVRITLPRGRQGLGIGDASRSIAHGLCIQLFQRDVASERVRRALSRAPLFQVTYTPGLHIYRPQTGSIELLLTGDGASQTAASVVWELEALAPPLRGGEAASQVLAASSMSGVATFEAGQRQATVSIPISWSSVKDHDILPFGANALSFAVALGGIGGTSCWTKRCC